MPRERRRRRRGDKPEGSPPTPPPPMPRERSRGDDKPERSSPPRTPPELHQPDQGQSFRFEDRQGVLLTDHGGPTGSVADVCSEPLPRLSRDPPPPRKELLGSSTLVESSITNTSSSLPQSPSSEVPDMTELEINTPPLLPLCVSSLTPTRLLVKYFVRVDKEGSFHTYPDHGGPFGSLHEAQQAIDSHHVVGRNNLCMDGLSSMERSVRYALYWPHDGTRKNSAEAFAAMTARRPEREVVKALLDKYNEDNGRLGDLAYELEEIVRYKPCFDGKGCAYRSYSHLNMTMKTKGVDDPRNKLYFVEVTCMRGEHEEYVLTCICAVEPDDNGDCFVCGEEMKHPNDTKYNHGRSMPIIRCSYADTKEIYDKLTVHDEAWLEKEEARVRLEFEEVAEAIKEMKAANLGKAIKEEKAAKRMSKEVNVSMVLGTIGDGHGKSGKYVVPARRK